MKNKSQCIRCEGRQVALGRMFCQECADILDSPRVQLLRPLEVEREKPARKLGAQPGRNSFRRK